jgi:hypothetical protein
VCLDYLIETRRLTVVSAWAYLLTPTRNRSEALGIFSRNAAVSRLIVDRKTWDSPRVSSSLKAHVLFDEAHQNLSAPQAHISLSKSVQVIFGSHVDVPVD